MKIIVGLGNPGVQYQTTRHNIGFQVVDHFAQINHIPICHRRFKSIYGIGRIHSQQVILVQPLTFMNRSGEAVKKAIDHFLLGIGDLVVVHDDLDLPFGKLRFKQRGGDGGHQGVRSIIETMGGSNFLRLKVGIGRPPQGMEPTEYVLNAFYKIDQPYLEKILFQATESLKTMLLEGLPTAMNRLHLSTRLFQSP